MSDTEELDELRRLIQDHAIVIEMQKDEIQTQKDLRREDREAIALRAREIASMYPQSSDGRNTFIIFADWIDNAK